MVKSNFVTSCISFRGSIPTTYSTLWIDFSTIYSWKSYFCFMFELLTSDWGVTTPT